MVRSNNSKSNLQDFVLALLRSNLLFEDFHSLRKSYFVTVQVNKAQLVFWFRFNSGLLILPPPPRSNPSSVAVWRVLKFLTPKHITHRAFCSQSAQLFFVGNRWEKLPSQILLVCLLHSLPCPHTQQWEARMPPLNCPTSEKKGNNWPYTVKYPIVYWTK